MSGRTPSNRNSVCGAARVRAIFWLPEAFTINIIKLIITILHFKLTGFIVFLSNNTFLFPGIKVCVEVTCFKKCKSQGDSGPDRTNTGVDHVTLPYSETGWYNWRCFFFFPSVNVFIQPEWQTWLSKISNEN